MTKAATRSSVAKLKDQKWKEQGGMCADCGQPLPVTGAVLDRKDAMLGYIATNTRVIHADCDYKAQKEKGYALTAVVRAPISRLRVSDNPRMRWFATYSEFDINQDIKVTEYTGNLGHIRAAHLSSKWPF